MFLTHTNSVYAEHISLMDHVTYPQYVHEVSNGGLVVKRGIKSMPEELVNYVLQGKHGANKGTYDFIRSLTQVRGHKIGLILASGGNAWTGYQSDIERSDQYPTHKILPMGIAQIYAGYLANQIGSFDYVSTDSTSCISGHSAWYNAQNMMKLGLLDAVVVVSVDNGISEEYLHMFGKHGLSMLADEEDGAKVKFRLGQGCNISVFETYQSATVTKHAPLAQITGMHVAAETYRNPLGISAEGGGYTAVIDAVDTHNLSFIKTHSTFSEDNRIENDLIKQKFGSRMHLINYKLRIGHTMGASTAIETALAIQEEQGTFLSLGAGMGNVFSSAVVRIL